MNTKELKKKMREKKNYYAKREIHRVMYWDREGMDEDYKFEVLEYYFKKWFGIK